MIAGGRPVRLGCGERAALKPGGGGMSNEMVRRVARAMRECLEAEPFADNQTPGRTESDQYVLMARAAIAAMREPTEAMTKAYYCNSDPATGQRRWAGTKVYRAMIHAALNEPAEIT